MHTPGPWEMWERTQFDESQHQQCVCICDDAGDDAGDLHEMAIIKGHNHAANACLIAAAPDLLEALLAVARVIENTYGHDEETGERIDEPGEYSAADIVEQLCGIEGLVSDAIAKATGETNV